MKGGDLGCDDAVALARCSAAPGSVPWQVTSSGRSAFARPKNRKHKKDTHRQPAMIGTCDFCGLVNKQKKMGRAKTVFKLNLKTAIFQTKER